MCFFSSFPVNRSGKDEQNLHATVAWVERNSVLCQFGTTRVKVTTCPFKQKFSALKQSPKTKNWVSYINLNGFLKQERIGHLSKAF